MANNNAAIVSKQVGSYEPQVVLDTGEKVSLVDLMITNYNQGGTIPGVKENLTDSLTGTVNNGTNNFYYAANPVEDLLKLPTLTELGFPETGYRLDVTATGYFRTPSPDPSIELKLVDASGNDIVGTLNTGTVISNVIDTPIKTTKAAIPGGTAIALDFRRTSGADDIILYHYTLLIQVVKE